MSERPGQQVGGPERSDGPPTTELDCRGMLCPLPVIRLAKHITDIEVGKTLVVLADDPAAATDIPAWCRMRAHDLVSRDGERYVIRRLG